MAATMVDDDDGLVATFNFYALGCSRELVRGTPLWLSLDLPVYGKPKREGIKIQKIWGA
jgi:hypothetical protein